MVEDAALHIVQHDLTAGQGQLDRMGDPDAELQVGAAGRCSLLYLTVVLQR